MFDRFWGNASTAKTLAGMIAANRIPQTLLLSGPEGVGKATLVRRFTARLMDTQESGASRRTHGSAEKIEQDDLSREAGALDRRSAH